MRQKLIEYIQMNKTFKLLKSAQMTPMILSFDKPPNLIILQSCWNNPQL